MRIFLYFGFVFFSLATMSANATDYEKYCNSRYGFCIDYPAHLLIKPEPENGDGRQFYEENFTMTVSGINNALDESLAGEMQAQYDHFDLVTYKKSGANWFVLSGYKGNDILYIKAYIGKGSSNYLHLQYSKQLKRRYDAVVNRISRSFKAGDISLFH